MSELSTRDVVIIGSGPAGLTAAIYTARANLDPLVIEGEPSSTGDQPGGQLMLTTEVENFPGFIDGIMGPELMGNLRAQAARFGAEYLTEKVSRVDFSRRPFGIWIGDDADDEPTVRARTVIVSTGARSLMLNLPEEERLLGHGLSTCATCDGFFFKGLPVAVVGGGDTAMEEAIYLSKLATRVTVIHRRDTLRASKVMQDKAFASPNISFLWNKEVVDIKDPEQGKVTSLVLRDTNTGEKSELAVDGVFIGIGHTPNTALFKGQVAMHDNGYLKTHNGSRTSVPGVFAAGDVQDHVYRQAVTAAGSGCMAAIDAERFLSGTLHEARPKEHVEAGL